MFKVVKFVEYLVWNNSNKEQPYFLMPFQSNVEIVTNFINTPNFIKTETMFLC